MDKAPRDKEATEEAHRAAARALGSVGEKLYPVQQGKASSTATSLPIKGKKEKGTAAALVGSTCKGGHSLWMTASHRIIETGASERSPPRTLLRRKLNEPSQRHWCSVQLTYRRMMIMAHAFWARHIWVPVGPVKDALFLGCRRSADSFPT